MEGVTRVVTSGPISRGIIKSKIYIFNIFFFPQPQPKDCWRVDITFYNCSCYAVRRKWKMPLRRLFMPRKSAIRTLHGTQEALYLPAEDYQYSAAYLPAEHGFAYRLCHERRKFHREHKRSSTPHKHHVSPSLACPLFFFPCMLVNTFRPVYPQNFTPLIQKHQQASNYLSNESLHVF